METKVEIKPQKNKNHEQVVHFKVVEKEDNQKPEVNKDLAFYDLLQKDKKVSLFKKDINFPAKWSCQPFPLYKTIIESYYNFNNVEYKEIKEEGLQYIFNNDPFRLHHISLTHLSNHWNTTPKKLYTTILKLYFKYLKGQNNE